MEKIEKTKKRLAEIKVRFGGVNEGNIKLLEKLNDVTLEVKYS